MTFVLFQVFMMVFLVHAQTVIIDTELGTIEGTVHKVRNDQTVYSFKGIRYALPPIGSLRFRPSQLNQERWNGIYNATDFGSTCIQSGFLNQDQPQSEDCLFLNIYTPNINKSNHNLLPVMVFIHGGAFQDGSGSANYCDGINFVGKGQDFVYISINYRLNVFGFLSSQQLYDEDPVNYPSYGSQNGIYDQIIALKWINKYISDYGGDSTKITIFGESAGGLSVCSLAITPLATGLFSRGLIESGSCNSGWGAYNISFGLNQWETILETVGLPNNMTYLRSLSARDLFNNISNYGPWVVAVDGYILYDQQINIYKNLTTYNFNELIIGSNSMDGIVAFPWHLGKRPSNDAEYKQFLEEFLPNNKTQQDLIYSVYYPPSNFPFYPPDHNSFELAWFSINSDVCLLCPSLKMNEQIKQKFEDVNVYIYQFAGPGKNGSYYAGHGSELVFVFDTHTLVGQLFEEFPWDQTLSNAMLSSWTNFGKFMQPNVTDKQDNINVEWSLYSEDMTNVMIFRDKIEINKSFKQDYRNGVCDFWYNECGEDIMVNICNDGANITSYN